MALRATQHHLTCSSRATGRMLCLSPKPTFGSYRNRSHSVQVRALFSPKGDKDRKFITREEEPEEFWTGKSEKAGANPLADPIAIVGIIAILFPFIFVLVAIATGAIDLSVYK